jgi:hypothetical protein
MRSTSASTATPRRTESHRKLLWTLARGGLLLHVHGEPQQFAAAGDEVEHIDESARGSLFGAPQSFLSAAGATGQGWAAGPTDLVRSVGPSGAVHLVYERDAASGGSGSSVTSSPWAFETSHARVLSGGVQITECTG